MVSSDKGVVQKGKERLTDLSRLSFWGLAEKPLIRFRKDGPLIFIIRLPYYILLLFAVFAVRVIMVCRVLVRVADDFFYSPKAFTRRLHELLRTQGLAGFVRRARQLSISPLPSETQYRTWLKKHKLTGDDLREMSAASDRFEYRPKISVVVPTYNTDKRWLIRMIESVISQVYKNWELCIADDASTQPCVAEVLNEYQKDIRIKVVYRKENGHICRASNSALELATGEFIALLDNDDELAPEALYEVVKLLNEHPDADMIYSDEDHLDWDGRRASPFFKPGWSPDLLMSHMYTTHFGVYRKELIDQIGGFRAGYEGAQDYDLVLRLTEKTDKIHRIPKILYHWRELPGSTSVSIEAKPYAIEAGRKALEDAMKRRGIKGRALDIKRSPFYRVRREIIGRPKVTIIIPTKDNIRFLKRCLKSIEEKTTYRNYEIVIVDNNSREESTKRYLRSLPHSRKGQGCGAPYKILEFNEPFNFSKINNFAVRKTEGDQLLFLNNDTEVINGDWLEAMLEHSQRDEVGAVGAKLLYPNGTIQHAGVVLGIGIDGVAGHSHRHFLARSPGYFNALRVIRNYSAVTGACLMTRRRVFEEAGMFEENLPRAYNDVDLCLKIREKGYLIVYTPFAKLWHFESASRPLGVEDFEREYMHKKWGKILKNDPYYNPNLTLDTEDFGLRL